MKNLIHDSNLPGCIPTIIEKNFKLITQET
jgi:hypothetical protein